MVNPDVIIDIKGVVVISSEEGATECNEERFMNEMDIGDGIILKCDDFFQNYELNIIITHMDAEGESLSIEVIANRDQLQPFERVIMRECLMLTWFSTLSTSL